MLPRSWVCVGMNRSVRVDDMSRSPVLDIPHSKLAWFAFLFRLDSNHRLIISGHPRMPINNGDLDRSLSWAVAGAQLIRSIIRHLPSHGAASMNLLNTKQVMGFWVARGLACVRSWQTVEPDTRIDTRIRAVSLLDNDVRYKFEFWTSISLQFALSLVW